MLQVPTCTKITEPVNNYQIINITHLLQGDCCCQNYGTKLALLFCDIKEIKTMLENLTDVMTDLQDKSDWKEIHDPELHNLEVESLQVVKATSKRPLQSKNSELPAAGPKNVAKQTLDNSLSKSVTSQSKEKQEECMSFSASFLIDIQRKSCSRNNFVTNLVCQVIPLEERRVSNVRGVLGKEQLNPDKMEQVRVATLQMYPCSTGENEDKC